MDRKEQRQKYSGQRPDDQLGPEGQPGPRVRLQLVQWAGGPGGLLTALARWPRDSRPRADKITLDEVQALIATEQVAQLRIEGPKVEGTLKTASGGGGFRVTLREDYVDNHLDEWRQHLPKGGLVIEEGAGLLSMMLINILPFVVILVVMIIFFGRQMRSAGGRDGLMPFVGDSPMTARTEEPDVTFDDVAGIDEAKEEVQEIIEFLQNPEKFQRIGGRIPRGVRMVGAPGTGKTLLSKAVAGEADVPFFSLCGSDFVELFVGVGAARVRDLFRKARQNQPSIIFLDEIDAVGRKRGTGLGGGHDEREQTLNAILSEMDGFTRDEGVIVIAATNRPDVLDPALQRPGRFDRQIMVDLPDLKGREEILEVHARDVELTDGVELRQIARGTPGFSGADLEALVNEAAIRAAMKGQEAVGMSDLEEARDKVCFGRQKKRSRMMSDEERRRTAFHEAAHALMAWLDERVEPLHKVTIIPRGVTGGMTMLLPEEDKYTMQKQECLGTIRMLLAGHVAEDMFCGDVSSGAADDIKKATNLARCMVTQWGMSEALGPVSYAEADHHVFLGNEITKSKQHSEMMAQKIDDEIRGVLVGCQGDTQRTCAEHRAELEHLAEALLELETLTAEDVERLFSGETIADMLQERQRREAEAAEVAAAAKEQAEDLPDEEGAADGYPQPAGSPA